MPRKKKLRKFWLCRNGHPMYRSAGQNNWRCDRCTVIGTKARYGTARKRHCKYGHLTEVGVSCKTCNYYMGVPWLKALDETGTGECPRGHPVSHYDESIIYVGTKPGQQVKRHCRACWERNCTMVKEWSDRWRDRQQRELAGRCNKGHLKSGENLYMYRGQPRCKKCMNDNRMLSKMRAAVKREKNSPLPDTHIDWVVVERILSRGAMDHIRRGTHQGSTPGERWVAYCTWQALHKCEPEDLGFQNMMQYHMMEWRDYGLAKKWPRITLLEVIGKIHSEDYMRGRLLKRDAMRKAAAKKKAP